MANVTPGGPRPHVVIVGGGFAGLYAARTLAKKPVEITIIDRHNYHLFQPLLYQVASAALSPGDIATPIRSILRKFKNIRVIMGEVQRIDLDGKRVILDEGDYHYDYLILAAGASGTYFGHDEWAQFAPGLKSIEDALEIRRRIFCAYETAERLALESKDRESYLTFVVIGGGATGVELAGAIREIATQTLRSDFRGIDTSQTKVVLLQSGDSVVPEYPDDLRASALESLKRLGVEVRFKHKVTNITAEGVYCGEEFTPARTVIWAAGVQPSPLGKDLGAPLDKAGRVKVNPDLTLPGHSNVYVVGDLAFIEVPGKGQLPGIGSVAIQEGVHAGRNVARSVAGEGTQPFVYDDRGQLATIGRNSAIGIVKGVKVRGFVAWLLWLLVHIYFLIGFENRLFVMVNWAYSYLSYNRSARLITQTAKTKDQ